MANNYGKAVTDPELLRQLNSNDSNYGEPVTDPAILAKLNSETEQQEPEQEKTDISSFTLADLFSGKKSPISYPKGAVQFGKKVARATEIGAEDIGNIANKVGTTLKDESIPALKQLVTNPSRAVSNVSAGLIEGTRGALNLPSNIPNILSHFELINPDAAKKANKYTKYAHIPEIDKYLNKFVNVSSNPHGANFFNDKGEQQPGDVLLRNAPVLLGAGKGLTSTAKAVYEGGKKLSPTNLISKMVGSSLSKEELARNLEATAGTKTGLGSVIGSPILQGLQESFINKVPFSGGNKAASQVNNKVLSDADQLVNRYLGETHPLQVTDKISEDLQKARKFHTEQKNALYDEPNKIADESNLKLELPSFAKKVKDYREALESTNILKLEPDTRSLLNRLENYKNPVVEEENIGKLVDKSGQPLLQETNTIYPKLKEANILSSKLREISNKYGKSPSPSDRHAAGIFSDLSKTLKSDIKNTILNSGDQNLIDSFNKAEKNYAENFSQFLDKDIHKFSTNKELADDIVAKFLISSKKADKAKQLSKLMRALPQETRELVKYNYFSRALEGEEGMRFYNPHKLRTLWKNLGENQKRVLMPLETERKEFDNFSRLVDLNANSIGKMMMLNPKTGVQNLNLLSAYMMMHPIKFAPEMIGSMLGQKFLTSPETREKIVKNIIERKSK